MNALEFMNEWSRMCKFYGDSCSGCPIENEIGICTGPLNRNNELLIAAVKKWSKEHPIRTFLIDFLEKYPNAILDSGIPKGICPHGLGYCKDDSFCYNHNCKECWNRPMQ